jgi:hypothetical protein
MTRNAATAMRRRGFHERVPLLKRLRVVVRAATWPHDLVPEVRKELDVVGCSGARCALIVPLAARLAEWAGVAPAVGCQRARAIGALLRQNRRSIFIVAYPCHRIRSMLRIKRAALRDLRIVLGAGRSFDPGVT